jgi:hypothetical protein
MWNRSIQPTNSRKWSTTVLLTRGFQRPTFPNGEFRGTCSLCEERNTTLALLLREAPSTHAISGFPRTGSKSKLAFPLGMGNFPETDIICPFTCFDACSYAIVDIGVTPNGDKAVCALPLVSYSANKQTYDSQLQKAFQKRFDEKTTPLVFVAALYITTSRKNINNNVKDGRLVRTIQWACKDLARSVKCQKP